MTLESLKTNFDKLKAGCLFRSLQKVSLSSQDTKKQSSLSQKVALAEKITDFERKGNHWLELMRNWIIEANQAGNLIKQENLSGMKDFLVDIGSNRRVAAGMLLAEFKMPWRDLAETGARARAKGAGEVNLSSNSELWTRGESDSRLPDANRPFYH